MKLIAEIGSGFSLHILVVSGTLETHMDWNILDTGTRSAEENMALDARLLDELGNHTSPILHFYDWAGDSATYGHFVDPSQYFCMEGVARKGLSLARRPTGGGVIFHLWDMAFSVLVPATCSIFSLNTLENYAFVNQAVLCAVKKLLPENMPMTLIPHDMSVESAQAARFCMARPTQYDVMWEGRKIAGAAQRRTKAGFLHQGTISLAPPSTDYLREVLRPEERDQVIAAMERHTLPLLQGKEDLKEELIKSLQKPRA